jgi:hypothetical protein
MEHRRCSDHHDVPSSWLRTGLVLAEAADATTQPHPDIAVLETIAADRSALATLDALAQAGTARGRRIRPRRPPLGRPIPARRAYRQPSAGATWVRMLSMAWAL